MVKDVRPLGPEAQAETLAQTEVARDCQVNNAIVRAIDQVTRRVAIGGNARHDFVLYKSQRIEPLRCRWIADAGIAYQLRAVAGVAIKVRINVAVGYAKRKTTTHLDDRRDA